jgi:SAM-dependent methyltransferase
MLKPQGAEEAARLTAYLTEIDFTPEGVRRRTQTDLLPGRDLQNLPLLLYRTREPDALNTLLRWFVVGEPVAREFAEKLIPSDILRLLKDCGLLTAAGEDLTSPVMFAPFEKYWIATDTYARLSKGSEEDAVLMINATTIFLLNLAIRTPCRSLLDLGTGCGVVAVLASAEFADQVTATDLTGRAASFARFNAWLNRRTNVEVLTGDLFQPVSGRRFERILSNPPFYITPSLNRVFAENPMELDGFCRNLVKQAPPHLEEGGFLQMLCEWVEIEGEPWQERLTEWFAGTGCDAIVFQGGTYDPVKYAQVRLPVVSAPAGREADCRIFQQWTDYYQTKKVKAIHAGLVSMRRRSGQNWVHFERVLSEPSVSLGEAILRRFAVRDHPLSDAQLLNSKLQVEAGIQLRQVMEFSDHQWLASTAQLAQTAGLLLMRDLSPDVADFVSRLDGKVPLGELVDAVAREAPVARETVEAECISLVRRLIDQGFVRVLT